MEKKKVEEPMQRLTFDIPESVHRRLKLHAVEKGVPMTKILLEWIQQQLAKADGKAQK
jgi:hypothetical protein